MISGMLMHHTWLEQQKAEKAKEPVKPEPEKKPEAEPVKKTDGRRKVSK